MLGIPIQALPEEADLDPKGRLLAFNSQTRTWETTSLAELSDRRYTHWQPLPPAPLGRPDVAMVDSDYQVEVCRQAVGIRLVSAVRVTHQPSGVSVAYGAGRTEEINRERAQALLNSILNGLTQREAEIEVLEDSLGQALALVVLLADTLGAPLAGLVGETERKALEVPLADVARALPYFEFQGLWEGMAELVRQLIQVATAEGQQALRESLLTRLPADANPSKGAGESVMAALSASAGPGLAGVLEVLMQPETVAEPAVSGAMTQEADDTNGQDDLFADDPLEAFSDLPSFDAPAQAMAQEAPDDDIPEIPGFDEAVEEVAGGDEGDGQDTQGAADGSQEALYAPDTALTDFGFDS